MVVFNLKSILEEGNIRNTATNYSISSRVTVENTFLKQCQQNLSIKRSQINYKAI